jgi:hypothetical protein
MWHTLKAQVYNSGIAPAFARFAASSHSKHNLVPEQHLRGGGEDELHVLLQATTTTQFGQQQTDYSAGSSRILATALLLCFTLLLLLCHSPHIHFPSLDMNSTPHHENAPGPLQPSPAKPTHPLSSQKFTTAFHILSPALFSLHAYHQSTPPEFQAGSILVIHHPPSAPPPFPTPSNCPFHATSNHSTQHSFSFSPWHYRVACAR